MRNETAVTYTVDAAPITPGNVTITDARIRLVGREEPMRTISSASALKILCAELVRDAATEEFHLICVDCQCRVITQALVSRGDISSVNAYPRNIAQIALLSNAQAVFLTHNHPGGTCRPSPEDISSTELIQRALKMFDIRVLDHMIITPSGDGYSMAQHGDINPYR